MLTNSRRTDKWPTPGRGFLTNSPAPDQQDYKFLTKFNAQGLGEWACLEFTKAYMVIKLSLNNYLRFDGRKIAQVRGQIEVHFHLLGL